VRPAPSTPTFPAEVAVVCYGNRQQRTGTRRVHDYLVHDRWLVRRLPKLVGAAGFELGRFRSHSYTEAPSSDGYMFSIIDRRANALLASGRITPETASTLKAEARRRSDAGEFFGHIAYAGLTAHKPSVSV
jgi:hypothetical protein